jgi:nucleoside-diphosphate-sugar epimerase
MHNYLIIGEGGMISKSFIKYFESHVIKHFSIYVISTRSNLFIFEEELSDVLHKKKITHVLYLSTIPKYGLSDSESVLLINKTLSNFCIVIDSINKINKSIFLILFSSASFDYHDLNISSAYLAAKRCAEIMLIRSELFNYKILKLFNVYGSEGSLVIDDLKYKFKNDSIPLVKIFGNPNNRRNFLLVERLIHFILNDLHYIKDNIIYISGPTEISIKELAEIFKKKYNKKYIFDFDDGLKLNNLTQDIIPLNRKVVKVGNTNDLINYI